MRINAGITVGIKENAYPSLKSGVTLRRHGSRFLLGLPFGEQRVLTAEEAQIVRALDGVHTCTEIARGVMVEPAELMRVIDGLVERGLVNLLPMSDTRELSDARDLSTELSALRAQSETSVLSHRASARDGGLGEFEARANFPILISGENRLARHLLVALQASGFTATTLIARSRIAHHIAADDVCGVVVKARDIGTARKIFIDGLVREAQIHQVQPVRSSTPRLIISTAPIEWDYVQRWMSEGSVHLHIHPVIGHEIEIGPLITPGEDPCLRCCILHKRDLGNDVSYEFIRSQAPTAAISFIAGLVALAIGEYAARGQSPLRAASYWYDLLDPLRAPDIRHWNFHPECGCAPD